MLFTEKNCDVMMKNWFSRLLSTMKQFPGRCIVGQ